MKEVLMAKLKDKFEVHNKPGRGNYAYVKTEDIIERINQATKGCWATEIIKVVMDDDKEVIVHVRVSILDEQGSVLTWHDGFGGAKKLNNVELSNIYKSAKSKAIKDAVKGWEVALDLEDDGSVSAPVTTSAPVSSAPSNTPPVGGKVIGTPVKVDNVVTGTSADPVPNVPKTPAKSNTPPAKSSTPPASNTPPAAKSTPPVTTSPDSIPPAKEASVDKSKLPPMNVTAPTVTTSTTVTEITDVQKMAIQSKLTSKSLDFTVVVKDLFESLGKDVNTAPPTLEQLGYQDALKMINFVTSL